MNSTSLGGSSGEKDFGNAGLFEGGISAFGDNAADENGDVGHAFVVEEFHQMGQMVLWAPARGWRGR